MYPISRTDLKKVVVEVSGVYIFSGTRLSRHVQFKTKNFIVKNEMLPIGITCVFFKKLL